MKKTIYLCVFAGSLLMSSGMALANCPAIDTIRYKCVNTPGGTNCTWQAKGGWWEGSTDSTASKDQKPSGFMKAIWFPYQSDTEGYTECYFYGPNNEKITLFQGSRTQGVPVPNNPQDMVIWINDNGDEGYPVALKCDASVESCQFAYGNVQE